RRCRRKPSFAHRREGVLAHPVVDSGNVVSVGGELGSGRGTKRPRRRTSLVFLQETTRSIKGGLGVLVLLGGSGSTRGRVLPHLLSALLGEGNGTIVVFVSRNGRDKGKLSIIVHFPNECRERSHGWHLHDTGE